MLNKLFSSKERIKILEYVLYRDSVTVVKVSDELSLSKGFVSEYLSFLYENKILHRNKEYHQIDNYLTRTIKILLNINKMEVPKIKKSYIKGIGIYGSWAYGTNNIHSDLDIWIKTESYPDEKELSYLVKNLRDMVRTDVQLLVLTPNKINQIKRDTPFYSSLCHGSIVLWGESIE